MTDRDLGALLERASEDVVELDLAEDAWARAVAQQRHRRRVVTTAAGAVAAAAVAVTTVQLAGSPTPEPTPANPITSTAPRTLSDGTAYDELPLEGKEIELAHFDAGLPSVITPRGAGTTTLGDRGLIAAPVAVYLQKEGDVYRPILVTRVGELRRVDTLALAPLRDASGNESPPLGPRAIGGGGRYVAFAQPGKVVLLDVEDGSTRSIPVPSETLESVGWTLDQGTLVARSGDHAWTIDPEKPDDVATAADGHYEGAYQLRADSARSQGLTLHRYEDGVLVDGTAPLSAPVGSVWGETIGTEQRAAAGAFFDQNITSKVIDRGNGPIYQGLVAVDAETNRTRVLLAPENPDGQTGRFKGCCTVLGWADAATVLFQTVGSHGSWVLAWNVATGRVYEVSRIKVDPPREEIPRLAINVGLRN